MDDDGTAFVGHLVGAKMSVVELGEGQGSEPPGTIDLGVRKSTPLAPMDDRLAERTGSQGYALVRVALPAMAGVAEANLPARILAPMVSVDPGDPERRSSVYYGPPFDGVPKQAPMVGVVDAWDVRGLGQQAHPRALAPRSRLGHRAGLRLCLACPRRGRRRERPGVLGGLPAPRHAGGTFGFSDGSGIADDLLLGLDVVWQGDVRLGSVSVAAPSRKASYGGLLAAAKKAGAAAR